MCVLFPAPRLSASVPCRVVGLHADMDSLRASLRAVAQTGVEQQNISHCIPNAFGPFGHGFNKSRTRMSAMPSLNPKIVWFPGPQHALFNSYFKLFQLCRCPWLLSLNQNRAPETSDQAQTHFPRLSKCIWHSIILDFNAVAAHEIAPKMLEFACHAAKTHFALVSANLELNVVRICIGMLKNGCKGPNMHCQGLEGSI